MLELIFQEVNNLQKEEDYSQATKEINYLTDFRANNKLVYIEKSISGLLMQLLKDQMLANVKDEYLIQYIDKPYLAESRIYPKRTRFVLIVTFVSFALIIFFITFHKFVYLSSKLES